MTSFDKEELRKTFIIEFGDFLKKRRVKKNISMDEVADFLEISQPTVSRYEFGDTDMKLSNLPLLSLCYDFPLSNCFSSLDVLKEVESFKNIVEIKRDRYQREYKRRHMAKHGKTLKAQIYDVDGVEVTEYIPRKETKQLSFREQLARADIDFNVEPFTNDEFADYLKQEYNEELLEMLDGASKMLDFIGETERKETVKSQIADFVIDNLIVERVTNAGGRQEQRAYMYYKKIFDGEEN